MALFCRHFPIRIGIVMSIDMRNNDCQSSLVGSEDFGETIIGHGQTRNGPDADVGVSLTTQKKDSISYATVVRGTKRFVRPE